jgi:molecular chaperone GrpE
MKDDAGRDALPEELPELDDEIEILEVIGVDEDTPLAAEAEPPAGHHEAAGSDEVVPFDDTPPPAPARAGKAEPGDDRARLIRLQADFENLRKRFDREREDHERHAASGLVARLLPTLDNFERALGGEVLSEEYDPFRDGISLIYRQLVEELGRAGLEPIEALGQPFDPARHDAIETDTNSDAPPNTVLEEFLRGYMFRGRLLRASSVRVSVDAAHPTFASSESEDD